MEDLRVQKQSRSSLQMITAVILVLIIAGLAYFLFNWVSKGSLFGKEVSGSGYEATFLTNGQVYFSLVDDRDKSFVTLNDIYYLRVQQNLQPATNNQNGEPSISLVKLGNELHGPEDIMFVNKDHILFIEPLKSESNVVQAIRKDKAGL